MKPVLIVGVGYMGSAYAATLQALDIPFIAIGRGEQNAQRFEKATGVTPLTGGVEQHLSAVTDTAIVCTNEEQTPEVVQQLVSAGVQQLLIEKPGALTIKELQRMEQQRSKQQADIFIAYNRRFYETVTEARRIIKKEGLTSLHFDFTEWAHKIEKLDKTALVKQNWFLANSTHVVDLAFFLGGEPKTMHASSAGKLSWHRPARFTGSGTTAHEALFSYHADWETAGRWGVFLYTPKQRLRLSPLEELWSLPRGGLEEKQLLACPSDLKPGLRGMVQAFLAKEDTLMTLQQQCERFGVYATMLSGGTRP